MFLKVPFFDFWRPPVMVPFFEFNLPPGKHHIHWRRRAYWKSFAGFRIQSVLSGVLFKEFCNTRIFWACRIFYIQLTNENFAKIEILKNSDFYKKSIFLKNYVQCMSYFLESQFWQNFHLWVECRIFYTPRKFYRWKCLKKARLRARFESEIPQTTFNTLRVSNESDVFRGVA